MGWSLRRATGLTYASPAQTSPGYTLITPLGADFSVLLDMQGRVVHRWRQPGFRIFHAQLLPSGTLLSLAADASQPPPPTTAFTEPPPPFAQHVRRLGGNATHLRELDWAGEPVWEYPNAALHHDFQRQANGNTWVAEWVELPAELADAVQGGVRRPGEQLPPMLSDDLVEIDRDRREVRRIHLWQLLDPVRDAICPLETRWEWTHLNSLAVMPSGELLVSFRSNSTVMIVAADGKSVRWKITAPTVYHQHHASALERGNVLVFDNGMHRIGTPFSRVIEVDPSSDAVVWEYVGEPPEQFFSAHISSAQRLPNGNVLVCEGASGRVFEVTRRGETVWEWVSPFAIAAGGRTRAWVFRAYRYAADFPGLAERELDCERWRALNRLYGLASTRDAL